MVFGFTLLGQHPGINGFLGTRGSLMLDVVFLAMFAVIPLLAWSVLLARRGRFALHKKVQLTLGGVLLLAVLAFEAEMRLVGWSHRAQPSPYWRGDAWDDPVHYSLMVHLFFAIPTAVLWLVVIVRALRNFPSPPAPGSHSRWHRCWARLAAFEMMMTALTGLLFYWLAFVA